MSSWRWARRTRRGCGARYAEDLGYASSRAALAAWRAAYAEIARMLQGLLADSGKVRPLLTTDH